MDDDDPWDMGRTDLEHQFIDHLRQRSDNRAHFDIWDFHPQLVVTLVVFDKEHQALVRTLRVDFDGRTLKGGEDPGGQIDPHLDTEDPDYFETTGQETIAELADIAFRWFQQQALRTIERQEWDGPDHTWLEWMMIEPIARPLLSQYPNRPDRPPDRVTRIQPRKI